MKTIIYLFIVWLSFVNVSMSQNYNWITPNKTYLKLFINSDGVNRINRSDFTTAGVDPTGIDPRTIKVLHKGDQVPSYFEGEEDGIFNENDFLDFYAKRNYGGPTAHRDANTNINIYTTYEYFDLYSDTSIYWIEWDGSNGQRMQRSTFQSALNYSDNYSFKRVHFEKDTYYYLGETTDPNRDFRYFSTERVVGESWYWRLLSTDQSITDTITINDLASSSSQLCSLKVFVYPRSFSNSVLNEHRIEIKINNVVLDTLIRDNFRRFDTTVVFPISMLLNNAQNSVTLHYIPIGTTLFEPYIDVDFFILSYPENFAIRNNKAVINPAGSDSTSKKFNVTGFNPASQVNVYDTRNNIRIEGHTNAGGVLTFTGKSNANFEIINSSITKKPFKIISRRVKDLVSAKNAADYLVIYNLLFETQAEQLRNHRQNFDSFRSVKAEIQDIYDIFNYGIENPVAIRNLVKYAYENWAGLKLRYVCLFGRASLDPKKNNAGSVFYQNLIPVYGNPPSDGYFVNFNIGTFTYYHQISVGRLPVYTVSEAQIAVEKIINYDQQQPDKWWKKFIFISGGNDRAQQIQFQNKSNALINNYIKPCPISGVASKIYRNDSTGYITYNYKDSIRREFNRGAMIVNFIGHAASQDWEIGLEEPNSLNNANKLPLVLSFTCFTGINAAPGFRSFGEKFFTLPNKCAIGFVGTTGWSFSGVGDQFNEHMIRKFYTSRDPDSSRRIGELLSYASQRLSGDSISFSSRNTINCYNLIGDPATKLLIPNKPEFDITQNDYILSNPFPALGELIKLTVLPKNLGTCADSLKIKFQLKKNGTNTIFKDTVVRNFGYLDTLDYFFQIDSIGNYTMSVILDPDGKYNQRYENNDSISFALTLRNLSFVPIKPLNNALLKTTGFRFTGLNPNVDLRTNNVKIILQVDTLNTFSSAISQTFVNSNVSGVTSGFDVTIPVQTSNTLYYLRTNAVINNDSSGWSEVQKLIYNPDISDKSADSTHTIYTLRPQQYEEPDKINVRYEEDGFVLDKFKGNLHTRSYGSNGEQASFFTINNINYYSDDGANTGLNIAKVKKLTGAAESIKNFRMTSPESSDSVLNFLNTFDSTDYIMTYIASFVPNADSLKPDAEKKFRNFGSIFADSVKFDFFHTWVFFGYLGADTTQTCEKYHNFYSNFIHTPLNCQINPEFQRTSGNISYTYGPADRWKSFSWEQMLRPNSSVKFDVYGIDRDNIPVILYSNITENSFVDLQNVNYTTYPKIKLDAKLLIDTATGLESPVMKSINFKYVPPAELVPDNYSFKGSDTTVQEGDSVAFKINYYNVGFIDAPVHINKWYINNQGVQVVLKNDTIYTPLKIDSAAVSEVKFSTAGFREAKTPSDTIDLYFETTLPGDKNEIFSFNNTAITQFIVQGDTVQPLIEVTYDGVKILNGDFVKSKPEIVLRFLDDSRLILNDTSNIKVYSYDFQFNRYNYIPYYRNGIKNPEIDITFPDDRFLQAIVYYRPTLTTGEHRFRYVARDVSGNFADSITNSVIVDNNLRIHDIANYPNPMTTETNFMFRLSGENNPSTCKIKIFSVAGRLIKELNAPAIVGHNNIYWDGKDNDGDYIANGTYLYKFIIQGDSQIETSIQKIAVLR
ncbi:MAG: C25 family cysteine peptidase [Ignavibacteria bacterium]